MDEKVETGGPGAAPRETLADPLRRRFGRAGLGASGVLLTLACKPVLGATAQSPSGFLSANQSTHGRPEISNGRRPEYWCGGAHWPIAPTTRFSQVFSCGFGTSLAGATLAETIVPRSHDPQQLACYLTAALFNARSGRTPFLREETLQAMFLEWRTLVEFSPTAPDEWGAAEIVQYLRATQS